MVNLVVLGDEGAVRHVCEVQVAHEMMLTARKGLPGHEVYAVQRNAAEFIESCGGGAAARDGAGAGEGGEDAHGDPVGV